MGIVDDLKGFRVETENASWHPVIFDKVADYITELEASKEFSDSIVRAYEDLCDRYIYKIVPLYNDRLRKVIDARDEAVHDRMMMEQRVGEIESRAQKAEARAEKAERERDEAIDAICSRCTELPCRESDCPWSSGQKEE